MEEKVDRLDFIKGKNFCSVKETFKRMTSQSTEENTCKSHI